MGQEAEARGDVASHSTHRQPPRANAFARWHRAARTVSGVATLNWMNREEYDADDAVVLDW